MGSRRGDADHSPVGNREARYAFNVAGGSPDSRRSRSSETPAGGPALGHAHLPDEPLLQRALALEKHAQVVGRGIVERLELMLTDGAQLLVGHDASSEGLRAGGGADSRS